MLQKAFPIDFVTNRNIADDVTDLKKISMFSTKISLWVLFSEDKWIHINSQFIVPQDLIRLAS